jgi:hypothetical protein
MTRANLLLWILMPLSFWAKAGSINKSERVKIEIVNVVFSNLSISTPI